jgi:glycosyltransferase involved in cell wall biosynthesis
LDAAGAAADYCKKNGIPLVVDIQDLWPEAFKLVFNIPVVSDLVFAPMTALVNRVYQQADKIVAVSQTYQQRGLQNCQKDQQGLCVFLGTDLGKLDAGVANHTVEKNPQEQWLAYAGTLGHSYNIEIIIDALNLLPEELTENLVFKVLGDGPLMERFRAYAKNCKVKVDFLGRLAYEKMGAYLRQSDIAVNPIAKGAAQSIINKHADYAAAGLPVVSTQECPEYRALLEEYECGINCPPEDAQAVADALESLLQNPQLLAQMGANSRRMARELFDRAITYQDIVKVIEHCME